MNYRFLLNVFLRALLLFIIANIFFVAFEPLPVLGKISAYNVVFNGRQRLPFGETPDKAYNFSLFNLEAMILSHEIAAAKKESDEYRVIFIGDSSTWGTLLKNDETLSGTINAAKLKTKDGRTVRAFNLGYPSMSLAKDLMILSLVTRYQPDLIVWAFTLESFPRSRQLASPLVANNPTVMRTLINQHSLKLNVDDPQFVNLTLWDKTIIGQRRPLADLFRLQMYGVMWAATGIDQYYPEKYQLRADDLQSDVEFYGLKPPKLNENDLALDVLSAGAVAVGGVPVVFVNEPIFISAGKNSDARYNFFYPKWAYDDFRLMVEAQMKTKNWRYVDVWNMIAPKEFTNSAVHVTPKASGVVAAKVGEEILRMAEGR
ncbi:MAG: hypothetical protein HZB17_03505 [Chloroflexi bacterium]|nr:hypothetical protein [Chloroflexota bacterium]